MELGLVGRRDERNNMSGRYDGLSSDGRVNLVALRDKSDPILLQRVVGFESPRAVACSA